MLYCPKCQATYKDGTQRFCTNEGARLLPSVTSEQSGQSSKGVFTSLLSKTVSQKNESFAPELEKPKGEPVISAFQPPIRSKFFKPEKEDEIIEESTPAASEIPERKEEIIKEKTFEHIPLANIINPSLIPEKQFDSDKLFSKEPEKSEKSADQQTLENETILESFNSEDKDLLEVKETTGLTESSDEIELFADEPLKSAKSSMLYDDNLLNTETNKTTDKSSDSEIELDFGGDDDVPEITESESEFEINLDEPFETDELLKANSEIELEVDEPEEISAISEQLPKIELDLDEIEDVSIPETPTSEPELDLESKKEINLADSIPNIELDLADLDEVSIPSESEIESESGKEQLRTSVKEEETPKEIESIEEKVSVAPVFLEDSKVDVSEELKPEKEVVKSETDIAEAGKIKATEDTAWEKRSSDSSAEEESKWFLYPLIGIIILALGLLGFFYLTNQNNLSNSNQSNTQINNLNQPNTNANSQLPNENLPANSNVNLDFQNEPNQQNEPKPRLNEAPPRRQVTQPPNTVLYRNEKKNLKGFLAKNFLGFSIYYPKDWTETKSNNKYLDIAKKTPDGLPIKQLLITRYDSNGTFEADKPIFVDLVEKSNADLRAILSNYQIIFEGETKFQSGRWNAYEVKFQGIGSDKKLIIWGRRLWIPVQRPGMKSGFIITMIGTSLSDDVKSVADLGETDDLAEILKTFEPEIS